MKNVFRGSITALITPFRGGAFDEQAFRALVDWQIAEGSHGLVPCGTTGESPTLSLDEHCRVVESCIEAAAGRVPVIAGCGSNSTAKAVAMAEHARRAGADAVLVVTPYYNKPTPEGQFRHFEAVHNAAELPMLLYNIPGRTAVDVSLETMCRMRVHLPNFVGLKDATADLSRVADERRALGDDFSLLSGEDATALEFNIRGGQGCVSVTANIAPALCAAFQMATLEGRMDEALELNQRLAPLHRALFVETNPGPVKYAASLLGVCASELRLPMVEPEPKTRKLIADVLATVGLEPVNTQAA